MEIPDHLSCLLWNLYAGQEAIVRTGHGKMDWFQIGNCILSRLYIATLLIYLLCRVYAKWLVVSDSLWPHGLLPARLLCPWVSPGKNTGVGCRALVQGIFPTQQSNLRLLRLLHWQVSSLAPRGKPLCRARHAKCWSRWSQAGIKIAGRNNNLRDADDTMLTAENEEELKSPLMKVKEESEKS